jgi:lysyl-tRNA synthetase class 2
MDIELLKERTKIIKEARNFFDGKNYLEVDTPLLAPDLIPESCLEVFQTERLPPEQSKIKQKQAYWLIPSPEIWMKKLIAQHKKSIYQICKSFRNGESSGLMHSPEFTMLEYYTMDADYKDSLAITENMFESVLSAVRPGSFYLDDANAQTLKPPFICWTMDEAFSRLAGFSLTDAIEHNTLLREAKRLGLNPPDPRLANPATSSRPAQCGQVRLEPEACEQRANAALYDLIFIHAVEPKLPKEKPVVLLDYPAIVPCLAALNTPPPGKNLQNTFKQNASSTRQRWELYIHGIEVANCFSEETNPRSVRDFFNAEAAAKEESALLTHHIDKDYWKIFEPEGSFPRCSGVAMGLDRFIMALVGRKTIDSVLPFPMREA